MLELVSVLSGPVIGAGIGYFTNYIAVKMLFHPRNPVRVGRFVLPFTPGIIPKRKKELGRAIGRAVEDELFGGEEIKRVLLAEETRAVVAAGIAEQMESVLLSQRSLREMIVDLTGRELYSEKRAALNDAVTDKIVQGAREMELGRLMLEKGGSMIMEKLNNPLIAMFLTPELLQSLAAPVGEAVNSWLETDGRDAIYGYVDAEIEVQEQKQPQELLGDVTLDLSAVQERIADAYADFVDANADALVKQFKIQEIIESRVGDMSNAALENLVLSVMKNELGMIVNLGAVIGCVIGVLNIFI
ncbi:MAG: DUF445 family protein [Lachnospiraceae bacterium]|nr:DUF445 family protein [Lachnospiraceae bacterium]